MNSTSNTQLDVAVIGGGIAGLWLLNRLLNEGYNACLFEAEALGGYQTVASQGMIHGGVKYALQGKRTEASETIADMPGYWRRCLNGEGDVDLRKAKVLSDHFYMWSTDSWWSRLLTFGASLSLRGRISKVSRSQRPPIFQTPEFGGGLYQLLDVVMDVPSVVAALVDNAQGRIFKLETQQAQWQKDADGQVSLAINDQHQVYAKQFVLTAGKGNGDILQQLQLDTPKMQLRPLQQVMVKHHNPHAFFGHCVTSIQETPRLTISSHPMSDGSQVWYLGGTLAEEGVGKSSEQLIADAKHELQQLMPWLDLSDAQWQTLPVDRAELAQPGGKRPDSITYSNAKDCLNLSAAWPTKLTLAPLLANHILTELEAKHISPSGVQSVSSALGEQPPLAPPPWQQAFATSPQPASEMSTC
ncbi:FAD-dependent oxidoreductase [Maricurvus nonylphenolicus]|uniref:NAD(P)/FAD-dependent oxidoreductase n=1 Tax=Maricurvus nonylphenolicus TaxID=1008307 RepID=UPI0036F39711